MNDFLSIPPPKQLAKKALGIAAGSLLGMFCATLYAWSGTKIAGVVTQGELDKVAAVAEAALQKAEESAATIGRRSDVEARKTLADSQREDREALLAVELRVGNEIRTRVYLQVAQHVGADPKRKRAAEAAAVNARAKYDELVMKTDANGRAVYTPTEAADKVLELARVPR